MASDPRRRLKILRALRRSDHRYVRLRATAQTISLAILLVVPLSGLARVDLWGGQHRLFFQPVAFRPALAGVLAAIAALYVVTFLSNVVAGRLFCGWGCPVGQLNRMAEILDTPRLGWRARVTANLRGAFIGLLFVVSMMLWWVDPRVFVAGSLEAAGIAWGLLLLLTGWSFAHGRWWRWRFCMSACPIGLYYSFVSPASWFGVNFRNQQQGCIECNACDNVCPVDLRPRELSRAVPARGGLAIADAPGRNHCLECGDCVRACEWMVGMKGDGPVPLLLGYYSGPQRIVDPIGLERRVT
jgi:ferredoxin-type protein NapH